MMHQHTGLVFASARSCDKRRSWTSMTWQVRVPWSCRRQGKASTRTAGVSPQCSLFRGSHSSVTPVKGSRAETGYQKPKADLWIKLVQLVAQSWELTSSWGDTGAKEGTCALLLTAAGRQTSLRFTGARPEEEMLTCADRNARQGKSQLADCDTSPWLRMLKAANLVVSAERPPLNSGRNAPAAKGVKRKTFTVMLRCEGRSRGLLGHGSPRGEQVITTEAG